ncbi:MAG: T9SS type A sorting domain-containing protein, partial [Gemmatimonadota bacterium]|nr:T9SS type A sorting domain-containing protein [Gemmatimonadota bacterium]
YDTDGVDTSKVVFYAWGDGSSRQNIAANIISWSKEKIVATVPAGVPASRIDVAQGNYLPDTIRVSSAIYGGFDTYPFTVVVDSSGFENLEVVNITATSATVRYRTDFTGADSVIVASSSDTLDIHSGNFSDPTFVEKHGGLSQMRSSVEVFHDQGSSTDGVHLVQLTDLSPSTVYRFIICSGNRLFAADSLRNVNGPYMPKKIDLGTPANNAYLTAFCFRTLPSSGSSGSLFSLKGKTYYSGGAAEGATVTLRMVKADTPSDTSLPITTTVGSDSLWHLNLANLHKLDGSSFSHAQHDVMLFQFDGAEMGYEEYDTLRAADDQAPMTIRTIKIVSYVEYDMELKTGLNLIGLPVNLFDGEPDDAHQFLGRIQGGTPSISRYVTATGTQETITRSIDGSCIGASNFDLQIEEGYFVGVQSKSSVQFKGRVYTEALPVIEFQGAGLYFVSRPAQDPELFYSWDASQLLQSIPEVSIVIRYDTELQRYKQYFKSGDNYYGTNFGIDVGQGYIFEITAASQWDPNGPEVLLAGDGNKSAGSGESSERVIVLDLSRNCEDGNSSGVIVSGITSSAAAFAWGSGLSGGPGRLRISLPDGTGARVVTSVSPRSLYGINYVLVNGLKPSTEYLYSLENSAGFSDVEQGTTGKFTTAGVGIGLVPYTLYGRLVGTDGSPLGEMLVLLRLKDPETGTLSGYISAVSDKGGRWVVNLANLKEKDTGRPYSWSEGHEIEMTIMGGAFRSPVYTSRVMPGSPHNIAVDLQAEGSAQGNASGSRTVSASLPKAYALSQNFPNPFNPSTTISFAVPEAAGPTTVRLDVFNLRGQLVATLVNSSSMEPGEYRVQWEGVDSHGKAVSSGVYFYRLRTPSFNATRKMVILK